MFLVTIFFILPAAEIVAIRAWFRLVAWFIAHDWVLVRATHSSTSISATWPVLLDVAECAIVALEKFVLQCWEEPWTLLHILARLPTSICPALGLSVIACEVVAQQRLVPRTCQDSTFSKTCAAMPSMLMRGHVTMRIIFATKQIVLFRRS